MNGSPEAQQQIIEYIASTPHEFIDLSGFRFQDFPFEKLWIESFPKPLVVRNCIFKDCRFTGTNFHGLDMRGSILDGTYFEDLEIGGPGIVFERTVFWLNRIPFDSVTMRAEKLVTFDQAVFRDVHFPFLNTVIESPQVHFRGCKMSSENLWIMIVGQTLPKSNDSRYLSLAIEYGNFVDLVYHGDFLFRNDLPARDYAPELRFENVNFDRMKSARFHGANLSRTRFAWSNLRSVVFNSVVWPKQSGRNIAYDEISKVDQTGSEELKRLYIALKCNYEDRKDYIEAGDWFYREMEIRRRELATKRSKTSRWLRQNALSLIALYRRTAEYGENYVRPLLWLLLFDLPVYAMIYRINRTGTGDTEKWGWLIGLSDLPCGDWGEAFRLSLATMTFQVGRYISPPEGVTFVVYVSQVLLTLVLTSLFLLAVRRKFRRS